eukprot:TRINITY_DN44341_c0_g1_i1.p1 TRINITY_DN44341_c0_g1~~TRINITY_DN44341_c0_g1_i1.p1  ORF type:complete len:474 (+),score=35.35 TRINITY_DN44341_c0_g1_i1:160-1422(+)
MPIQPKRNQIVGSVDLVVPFMIDFEFTLHSPNNGHWNNLFYIGAPGTSQTGNRPVAFWIQPSVTKPHVRVGDNASGNNGCDPDVTLVVGQLTRGSIAVSNTHITIVVGGVACSFKHSGKAGLLQQKVYVGDDYWNPADATLNNFVLSDNLGNPNKNAQVVPDGCSSTALSGFEFVPGVVGCTGVWDEGMEGAQHLCGTGYQVCSSDAELVSRGMTRELCRNPVGPTQFFATKVAGRLNTGGWGCDATGTSTNDVYGCGKTDTGSLAGCSVLNHARGFPYSSGGWSFGTVDGNEQGTAMHLDPATGGVMCCATTTSLKESGSNDQQESPDFTEVLPEEPQQGELNKKHHQRRSFAVSGTIVGVVVGCGMVVLLGFVVVVKKLVSQVSMSRKETIERSLAANMDRHSTDISFGRQSSEMQQV